MVLVLADAFPAPWASARKYWHDRLIDPRNLRDFRMGNYYLKPPSMTVITAGSGQLRVLKKIAVAHFSTSLDPLQSDFDFEATTELDWRPHDFLPFLALPKLIFDFHVDDQRMGEHVANMVASNFEGVLLPQVVRSMGDVREHRRRQKALVFDEVFDEDKLAELRRYVSGVMEECTGRLCIGWEDLYSVPEEAYIIDVDDLDVFRTDFPYELLSEVVVVSKRCVIAVLHPWVDASKLAFDFQEYVQAHPEKPAFVRVFDSGTQRVWSRPSGAALAAAARTFRREKDMPWSKPTDIYVQLVGAPDAFFEKMLLAFLTESFRRLNQTDAAYPTIDVFHIWFYRDGQGKSTGKAMLFGAVEHLARCWFYAFWNFTWEDSRGMQTIYVKASSEQFDEELNDGARRMQANYKMLTIDQSRAIGHALSLPAPSPSTIAPRRLMGDSAQAPFGAVAPPPPPPAPSDGTDAVMEQWAAAAQQAEAEAAPPAGAAQNPTSNAAADTAGSGIGQ